MQVRIRTIRRLFFVLLSIIQIIVPAVSAGTWSTEYDDNIIVPERVSFSLIIFKGGTSAALRNWNDNSNRLWSMPLRNAAGVAAADMAVYNSLITGENSLNDVKRVIYQNKIHMVVTGNGGNLISLYDFAEKKCVFWSRTTASGPHDGDFIPLGTGYIVVADATDGMLELYDISKNNKGRISGSETPHAGVHSVHWDAKQQKLWAWGGGADRLKSYKVVFTSGQPKLVRESELYANTINYDPGTGHGGAPMIKDGKRYLILAGDDGIVRFDTETREWKLLQAATEERFTNPKGLSYDPKTGEIIIAKADTDVYSMNPATGSRHLDNSQFYKARWWSHNEFSYPSEQAVSVTKNCAAEFFTVRQSGNRISIYMQGPELSPVTIVLTNSRGQLADELSGSSADGTFILRLQTHPAGVYFLRARMGKAVQVKSLVLH